MIVDDHEVVRSGLRMLIENQPQMMVVGEAGTVPEAVAVAQCADPEVILLDIDLGGESGLTALPQLTAGASGPRVLILTGLRDSDIHRTAIRLGAVGLVLKDQAAEVLIKAIERVHSGEAWVDRTMTANILGELRRAVDEKDEHPEAAKIATLSDREREVITLIGEGLKNRQIAEHLFISETTVHHHLTSIFSKLEVSDRFELMIYAFRHGLATPPQ